MYEHTYIYMHIYTILRSTMPPANINSAKYGLGRVLPSEIPLGPTVLCRCCCSIPLVVPCCRVQKQRCRSWRWGNAMVSCHGFPLADFETIHACKQRRSICPHYTHTLYIYIYVYIHTKHIYIYRYVYIYIYIMW